TISAGDFRRLFYSMNTRQADHRITVFLRYAKWLVLGGMLVGEQLLVTSSVAKGIADLKISESSHNLGSYRRG
ncbi:hypothetical protein QQP08_025740, partial [Theobroma cacao]